MITKLPHGSAPKLVLAATIALGLAVFLLAGCASGPFMMVPAPPPVLKPPFSYEPLKVRNSCFVESVHIYDLYFAEKRGGPTPWSRILEWGNQEGDFDIATGHAVSVFGLKGQLWTYDINYGFTRLSVPFERRGDITDVSPPVFSRYSQFRPVFAKYRDDFPQRPAERRPNFLFYHANPDVRDATRVASELGRFRPVTVVEFSYPEKDRWEASVATVFTFGARVCVYFPRRGTHVSPARFDVKDMRWVTYVVQRIYPGAKDVRAQPGGYLLFPPKS